MRRRLRSRSTAEIDQSPRPPRRAEIPAVPTFEPNPKSAVAQPPSQAAVAEDPTEEAVRRMVEAAYT
jgi:hypothetical protein